MAKTRYDTFCYEVLCYQFAVGKRHSRDTHQAYELSNYIVRGRHTQHRCHLVSIM